MNAIGLYKFVNQNDLEFHYVIHKDNDVVLFVPNYHIENWNKLLGSGILDEEGLECNMKDGYFCFMMKYICEYFDIELSEVFKAEDEK